MLERWKLVAIATAAVLIGCGVGYVVGALDKGAFTPPIARTVAISWGSRADGGLKAFYGAHVYVRPVGTQYDVYFTVYVDRPTGWIVYQQTPELLGRVPDWKTAVAKFGVIRWTPTQLLVGDGSAGDKALLRSEIENHR